MKSNKFIAAVAGLLLTCTSVRAGLLAYEPFATGGTDYSLGDITGQNPASFGFSGAWTKTFPTQAGTFEVVAAPLGVTGNPGLGGAARFSATLTPAPTVENPGATTPSFPIFTRPLAAATSQSILYYSLLFRQDDASATQRTQFRLTTPTGQSVEIGTNGGQGFEMSSTLPSASAAQYSFGSLTVGTIQQLVLKIDTTSGTVTYWRNPGLGLTVDPATPSGTVTFTPGSYSFSKFEVTCYVAGAGTRTATFDEIMLGETIADVTAAQAAPTGDLLAYEPFRIGGADYGLGSVVNQEPQTFGFIGKWTNSRPSDPVTLDAVATSIDVAGFDEAGGAATMTATDSGASYIFPSFQRSLAFAATGDVLYLSLFFQQNSAAAQQRSYISLNGPGGRYVDIGTNGSAGMDLRSNLGGTALAPFSFGGASNTIEQLVVKIDGPGNTVKFWRNPGIGLTADPAGAPLATIDITGVTLPLNFNSIELSCRVPNGAGTLTRVATFDEIRLGKTIQSVTSAAIFPVTQLPVVSIQALHPSGATLTLNGPPGAHYNLQYSPNLELGSWLPFGSTVIIPPAGSLEVDDTASAGKRFYRAYIAP